MRTSNIERPTSNTEGKKKEVVAEHNEGPKYDLEERLLEFAARIIRLAETLPRSPTGKHVSGQVIRSGTAPMAHHGEAQSAESRKDFIHKMKIALKELRETQRWLKLIQRVPLLEKTGLLNPLLTETDELIRIFVTSINTARERRTSNAEHPMSKD